MKKHIGSTIALVLGILSLVSGLTKPDILIAGLITILGALAYRSAKKRMLSEVKATRLRKGLEVSALVIIIAVVLLQKDLKYLIATHPVPNLIIPLWAVVAYGLIALKRKRDPQEINEQKP